MSFIGEKLDYKYFEDIEKSYKKVNRNYNSMRGIIEDQHQGNCYYILNEVSFDKYVYTFSAIKVVKQKKDKNQEIPDIIPIKNEPPYYVKFIDKKIARKYVFDVLGIEDESKYYDSLRKSCSKYKELLKGKEYQNIQEIFDFIEGANGLYFILEFCEYSLQEYLEQVYEPLKGINFPMELKFRYLIIDILKTISKLQETSTSLCCLLNTRDIMIKELKGGEKKGEQFMVKLPNPFLSNIFNLLYIGLIIKSEIDEKERLRKPIPENDEDDDDEINTGKNNFPCNIPPELVLKIIKLMDSLKISNFDLISGADNLLSDLSSVADIWALGILIYNICFGTDPFVLTNATNAYKTYNDKNFKYEVFPFKVSINILNMIESCLQTNPIQRLQRIEFERIVVKFEKENQDPQRVEKELMERISKMLNDVSPKYLSLHLKCLANNFK